MMKALVGIASYGTGNDEHLHRLLEEYRRMRSDVDIVVFSNIAKQLGPGVEVVVGLPATNPWSLPFAHKRLFAERLNRYDLFIYSEDDTLIEERNIEAFLRVTKILPAGLIAGYLRTERARDGKVYFSTVNSHFHWDPASVTTLGEYTFAYFSNEHSACYLLTREQLKKAIESGGFLIGPHEGRYDLLVTAATDPYAQCGFRKMVCISHLDDFTVRHLTNKYVGRMGLEASDLYRQIDVLLRIERDHLPKEVLFNPETKVFHAKWSKNYYEPSCPEMVSLIPRDACSVLSVGCGWGALEGELVQKGLRVVAVPMDSVIASCAKARGVEIIYGDLEAARKQLSRERFNCLVVSNVLHLVEDPLKWVSTFVELLSDHGMVIVKVPNFAQVTTVWRRFRREPGYQDLGDYGKSGVHLTTPGIIREWFQRCGLAVGRTVCMIPQRGHLAHWVTLGLADPLLAEELMVVGTKN